MDRRVIISSLLLGKLRRAQPLLSCTRKNVVKSRGTDADHMHGFDRFLWRNKEDATLSEVIGRESWIQALDRDELIQQLLGEYRKPTLDLRRELFLYFTSLSYRDCLRELSCDSLAEACDRNNTP